MKRLAIDTEVINIGQKLWELAANRFFKILDKHGANSERHLKKITKVMKNPTKLAAWFLVLENENFHDHAEEVYRKLQDLVGKQVTINDNHN